MFQCCLFFCPNLGISHFFRNSDFFHWKKVFRNQNLGSYCDF
jgi:hypothetical protein